MKPRLIVRGDAQAGAIARFLETEPTIANRFEVVVTQPKSVPEHSKNDVILVQKYENDQTSDFALTEAQVIHFPRLKLELLWPLSCVNPFDRPEQPSFPHGRFPYGNSYIVASVKSDAPPASILPFMRTSRWPASWPNLNSIFEAEAHRLVSLDSACDVRMAMYMLNHFASIRLFHAPNAPANVLLRELATRLAAAVLGILPSKVRLTESLPELLAAVEVPIHPCVAQHFEIAWFDGSARYHQRDGQALTNDQYFAEMIAHSYAIKYDLPNYEPGETTLIIYGNCQAEAVASILRTSVIERLRVVYVRSFEEPGASVEPFDLRDAMTCSVLWEQHDEIHPFPYADWLPPSTRKIRFPATDFNALWPLTGINPYVRPQPPKYPFGRFPYGERGISEAIRKGMTGEEAAADFLAHGEEQLPDLDRFLAIEEARLRARDAKCDVAMGEYVLASFRTVRLFWTVNHPTPALLSTLIRALIERTGGAIPPLSEIDIPRALQRFGSTGPLGVVSVPILPKVAEHYGLTWYNARNERFQNWSNNYSFEGYFQALAIDSYEALAERPSEAAE